MPIIKNGVGETDLFFYSNTKCVIFNHQTHKFVSFIVQREFTVLCREQKFLLYLGTGLEKCRHLRVKSIPMAFTGIFRTYPEYSGVTWHFRKNNS